MNVEKVKQLLDEHIDNKYQEFSDALIPNSNKILGVRVPILRKIAKEIIKSNYQEFLDSNDYSSHELLMLHAFVLGFAKDELNILLKYFKKFIPKVHDWAVNDTLCMNFKIAKKYQKEVWDFIIQYKDSKEPFELRIMIVMMLSHYINDEYVDRVLDVIDNIKNDNYYTKMGIAWALSEIMIKYRDKCIAYLIISKLDNWTYNKSIQKMIESFRVSDEDKVMIRKMKKKKGN